MKSVSNFLPQHQPRQRRLPVSALSNRSDTCTIRMTVDAGSITTLRQLAMLVCGDAIELIRIATCDGGARMQVWLCVRLRLAARLCEAILSQLPGALMLPSPSYPGVLR